MNKGFVFILEVCIIIIFASLLIFSTKNEIPTNNFICIQKAHDLFRIWNYEDIKDIEIFKNDFEKVFQSKNAQLLINNEKMTNALEKNFISTDAWIYFSKEKEFLHFSIKCFQ